MLDFLSLKDYTFLIILMVLVLLIIRLVRVLVVQDFYRSWVHLIRPALVLGLILLVYVGFSYGVSKTSRIWSNLAYINNYEPGDELDAWALSDASSTNAKESEEKYLYLMEHRKSWPVGLIEDFKDSSTFQIALEGIESDNLVLQRIVDTYWSPEDMAWLDSARYIANLNALKVIDSLHVEISKLNQNVLLLDSVYSMKIKTWLVTDSLRVQFIKNNQESNIVESPIE